MPRMMWRARLPTRTRKRRQRDDVTGHGVVIGATHAMALQATLTSITGTGLLRHVTGDVSIAGVENLITGGFTEGSTGTLCLS